MSFGVCPKCRLPLDAARPPQECPRCGLVFAKYLAAQRGESPRPQTEAFEPAADSPWWSTLLDVPEQVSRGQWIGRCILLALFALWGARVWATPITEIPTFVHLTLIPFHEAGHVLFWPFGQFVKIAGGTLGQWIMPIVCAVALQRQNEDNFGAALAMVWLAMSIMDASVYAYDALDPVLPLIGGGTGVDSFHDFVYLLSAMGQLKHAHGWGHFMHVVGTLMMLASFAWAIVILIRQRRMIDGGGADAPQG